MNKRIKRQTRTKTERHEITIIRANGSPKRHYCENCGRHVSVFVPEHAALMFRVNELSIEQLVNSERIHFADGAVLCGDSLLEYFRR